VARRRCAIGNPARVLDGAARTDMRADDGGPCAMRSSVRGVRIQARGAVWQADTPWSVIKS
jgi:hypothetical protein